MRYSIFALIFILSLGIFNITMAQDIGLSQTTINVEMIPENPKPLDLVYVSLTSYATNINGAVITWKINGKTQKTGVGERNFNFTVGEIGTETVLDIIVKTLDGEIVEKNFVIKPSEIDLIWQSRSFVPPFYKGKAMFSHQNQITFIAVPHITGSNGGELRAENLIYKWKKNGTVMENSSGFGKSSYTFVDSIISRPVSVEVEVSSLDNNGLGFGSIYVEPEESFVILYKKDPVYGIEFQKALQNSIELNNSKEVTIVGVPFFFGILNQASEGLLYKWSINGIPIGNDYSATTQVFRQKEGTSGSSKISLSIENTGKILQYASSDFNLRFGQ